MLSPHPSSIPAGETEHHAARVDRAQSRPPLPVAALVAPAAPLSAEVTVAEVLDPASVVPVRTPDDDGGGGSPRGRRLAWRRPSSSSSCQRVGLCGQRRSSARQRTAIVVIAAVLIVLAVVVWVAAVFLSNGGGGAADAPDAAADDQEGTSPEVSLEPAQQGSGPSVESVRLQSLRDVLLSEVYGAGGNDISGGVLMPDDASSPQHRAMAWLADEDGAQLPLPLPHAEGDGGGDAEDAEEQAEAAAAKRRIVQRYSLAVFYFSTGGGRGSGGWRDDYGFLSAEHECTWGSPMGVTECDESLSVTRIMLVRNGLMGTIPSEVAQLAELRHFEAYNNNLRGTIPTEIGSLRHMAVLRLSQNALVGPLPTELSNMVALRTLRLDVNDLTGTLPLELASVEKLHNIYLDSNRFTGTVPEIWANMNDIWTLRLESNILIGSIDFMCDLAGGVAHGISVDLDEVECECCTCCD